MGGDKKLKKKLKRWKEEFEKEEKEIHRQSTRKIDSWKERETDR